MLNNDLQSKKVELVTTIILIGFVVAVFFHYCMGAYLNIGFPYNTFLFVPGDKFNDLFNVLHTSSDFNPYSQKIGFEPALYFPFMYLFLYPLELLLSQWEFLTFFVIALIGFLVIVNYSVLTRGNSITVNSFRNIFILSVMTYPVLFTLDRGNLEAFVFIGLAVSIFLFYKQYYYLSAFSLAMVISMKGYPALFLILFLKERKLKPLTVCVFSTGLLVMGGLLLLNGGVYQNLMGLLYGLSYFTQNYIINGLGSHNNYSLYGLVRMIVLLVLKLPDSIAILAKLFSLLSIIIFIVITIVILIKNLAFWEQLTLISCSILLFMHISAPYKFLILYIPLWFFFLDSNLSKRNIVCAILFGLLLIPKEYFNIAVLQNEYFNLALFMNPLLLLILWWIIIFKRTKI